MTGVHVKLLQSVDCCGGKKKSHTAKYKLVDGLHFVIFEMLSVFLCVFVRQNEREREKKLTAPGIPRRSPIQVLTRPDPA